MDNCGCVLTKEEAYSVAEFISLYLFETIRNDEDFDSMECLRNIIHAYEKMCRASGYVGLTDRKVEDG